MRVTINGREYGYEFLHRREQQNPLFEGQKIGADLSRDITTCFITDPKHLVERRRRVRPGAETKIVRKLIEARDRCQSEEEKVVWEQRIENRKRELTQAPKLLATGTVVRYYNEPENRDLARRRSLVKALQAMWPSEPSAPEAIVIAFELITGKQSMWSQGQWRRCLPAARVMRFASAHENTNINTVEWSVATDMLMRRGILDYNGDLIDPGAWTRSIRPPMELAARLDRWRKGEEPDTWTINRKIRQDFCKVFDARIPKPPKVRAGHEIVRLREALTNYVIEAHSLEGNELVGASVAARILDWVLRTPGWSGNLKDREHLRLLIAGRQVGQISKGA